MIATGEEFLVVKARASAALNGCEPASLVHGPEITRDDSRFVDMAMCRTSGGGIAFASIPQRLKPSFWRGLMAGLKPRPFKWAPRNRFPGTGPWCLRENCEKKPHTSTLRSKNISKKGPRNCRSLHCATPDFLLTLVALVHFMRPSLRKGAHSALSSAAWQEIRVRFGRDDKGEGSASIQIGCRGG
jgi:hypothetical protein